MARDHFDNEVDIVQFLKKVRRLDAFYRHMCKGLDLDIDIAQYEIVELSEGEGDEGGRQIGSKTETSRTHGNDMIKTSKEDHSSKKNQTGRRIVPVQNIELNMSTNELQSYRLNDETIDQTKVDQSHIGMISQIHSSVSTPVKIRTNEHSIREQVRGCNIDEMVIKDQSLDDQDNDEQRTSFNRQDVTTNSVAAEPTYASEMSYILGPNALNDKTMKKQEELRMSSDKILIAERGQDMQFIRKRQSQIRQSMELNAAGRVVSRMTED